MPMAAPKIRIVLASHGEQSKGMLNTVQMLLGQQENIAAYSLYPEQPVTDLTEKLQAEVPRTSCSSNGSEGRRSFSWKN